MTSPTIRQEKITVIREFPEKVSAMLAGLSADQLDTTCGDGEWSVRQVAHHLADSHMNSFIRLKLILTEDNPPLKPYDQDAWATLPDTAGLPVKASLTILEGLHARWVTIFENLSEEQWARPGVHAEAGSITPDDLLDMYATHCREHLEQLERGLSNGKVT
jgi:hypothetical protein